MFKLTTILSCLFVFQVLGQDFASWRQYNYEDLGIQYKIPTCGFQDNEDCVGLELINEVYEGELSFVVGVISEFSDEYDLEHPYKEDQQSEGQLPSKTLKSFPELEKKATFSKHFFDSESYLLRYFIPLKNHYFFKIEIEGFYEDLEDDNPSITYFFDHLKIESPKSNPFSSDNELNAKQEGPLKGMIKTHIAPLPGMYEGANPKILKDEKGNIYMMWVHIEKGVCFSKIDPSGKLVSTITLPEDKMYLDFDLLENGFIVASSLNTYENNGQDNPKLYFPSIEVEAFDFTGKKQWATTLMKETIIKNAGDKGFQGFTCELKKSKSNILAYFPVRGKFEDGIVHQGDAYFTLDLKGNIIENLSDKWHVSHSFGQEVIVDNDYFGLFALGDAYPRGINYRFFDTEKNSIGGSINLFPFAGKTGWNYVGDTFLGNPIQDDENVYMVISTEENVKSKGTKISERENDLVLLVVSKDGKKVLEKNITNTSDIDEGRANIAFLGENILVTYEYSGYYIDMPNQFADYYMIISKTGQVISEFKPLYSHSGEFLQKWTKMGNDIMTYEHSSATNFVSTDKGFLLLRNLPFYHSDYIEIITIEK